MVSLLVGWALIAALVDIPLFARTAEAGYTQLDAALVLLRFLVALPIGAVLGGRPRPAPARRRHHRGRDGRGLGVLLVDVTWDQDALGSVTSNLPLVLGGLGFGLALAPVNAAMLASTRDDAHGVASALVVVARMIGMLVGISVLTTYGLSKCTTPAPTTPTSASGPWGSCRSRPSSRVPPSSRCSRPGSRWCCSGARRHAGSRTGEVLRSAG